MGQTESKPPAGTSAEDQAQNREQYKKAVAERLGVAFEQVSDPVGATGNLIEVRVEEADAKRLSESLGMEVPAHRMLITHDWAWVTGAEAVIHVPMDEPAETINSVASIVGMCRGMQEEGAHFMPLETCQTMGFTHARQSAADHGDTGAMLVADPVIKGLLPLEDGRWADEGPLHDDRFVPRGFLCMWLMYAAEYRACGSMPVSAYAELAALMSPVFMSSVNRGSIHWVPEIEAAFQAARAALPCRHMADGVTVDGRLCDDGRRLDVVMSGRCLASLVVPLREAFMREPGVPAHPESLVGVQSDDQTCIVVASAHEPDGTPITPETARFELTDASYIHPGNGEFVELGSEAEAHARHLLTPQELWVQRGEVRQLRWHIFAPAEMLGRMLDDVRREADARQARQESIVGMVMSTEEGPWAEYWQGTRTPDTYHGGNSDAPFVFRLRCEGLEFFEEGKEGEDGEADGMEPEPEIED